MHKQTKRHLMYVATVIAAVVIVILAALLLQPPIPTSTLPNNPNNPNNPGGGNNTNGNPTSKSPPGMSTQAATGVGQTTATLHGSLTSLGTASAVTVGFGYGTSASLAASTNVSEGVRTALGATSADAVGLAANTTYFFRAWALGDGFVTGSTLNFTTTPATAPPPNGGGNGHQVPPGWAHARCPHVPDQAPAYGERARCEYHETYGEMKKDGTAGSLQPTAPSALNVPTVAAGSGPGNRGKHHPGHSHDL